METSILQLIELGGTFGTIGILIWQNNGLRKSLQASEDERKELTHQIVEQYFKPIKKEAAEIYDTVNNGKLERIEEMLKDLKKKK